MSTKRVILFVIDGMKREVFYDLLSEGKLPGFSEIFQSGVWIRYGTTVFPSETLPSQASLFTGCQVKRHKIVSNAWLDREKVPVEIRDYNKPATAAAVFGYELFGLPTVLLPLRDNIGLANRDLSPDVPTIYESAGWAGLETAVVFNHFSRGATHWIRPGRTAVLYFAASHKARIGFRAIDAYTMRIAANFIRKNPLPNILTLYFGGLDAWGHFTGDMGQVFYLTRILDPLIGRAFRALEKKGVLSDTYFALTSDHGQEWIGASTRMINLQTLTDALTSCGYNIAQTPEKFNEHTDCYISIVGGCAQIYIRNRSTNNWHDPPEVSHILPAAKCTSGICTKAYPDKDQCPNGCSALFLIRTSQEEGYQVFSNGEIVPMEKFFWEKLDEYPQAFRNIYGMNCSRSGDMIIFSNFGEGCYFSDERWPRGHGSIAIEDTSIPIAFAGPDLPRRIIEHGSIIDIAPTILGLFGIHNTGMDGRDLNLMAL
ncbi:MAG: alkaline phosphatase family protein [bacterium]